MCTALLSHCGLNFRNAIYLLRASANAFVWSTVFQTLFDKECVRAVPVHTKSIHSAHISQIRRNRMFCVSSHVGEKESKPLLFAFSLFLL